MQQLRPQLQPGTGSVEQMCRCLVAHCPCTVICLCRVGTPSPDSALEYYYVLVRDDTAAGVS